MKNILYICLFLCSSIVFFACGKDEVAESDSASLVLNENAASLQERMILTNEEIELIDPVGAELTGLLPGIETFTALQVAQLMPPVLGGQTLQANDVVIDGFAVYVSYNMAGDTYAGGIDVLDITKLLELKILTNLSSASKEFNGLAKDGEVLYAVGASSESDQPAILTKIALSNGLLTTNATQYSLPSYAGTDVRVTADKVLTTSGDTGGLSIFTKSTMSLDKAVSLADLRSVDVMTDGSIMALSGQPGRVTVMNSAGDISRTISLGGASIAQSKSTLQAGPKWSLAALGDGGMTVFCNSNGAVIANVPQVSVAGTSAALTVTNAASSSNGLIFSANGEAGVYVYSLKDLTTGACGTGKVTLLGTLKFGQGISANAVFYKNGFLFVDTGLGGLKILTAIYTSTVALSSNL